jgi:ribosomal protein S12 methylthiotransferase accessory factor YcaO
MKYRVMGRAKVTWVDKASDRLRQKIIDIDECVLGGKGLTEKQAQEKVECLEKYLYCSLQWVGTTSVSRVE